MVWVEVAEAEGPGCLPSVTSQSLVERTEVVEGGALLLLLLTSQNGNVEHSLFLKEIFGESEEYAAHCIVVRERRVCLSGLRSWVE